MYPCRWLRIGEGTVQRWAMIPNDACHDGDTPLIVFRKLLHFGAQELSQKLIWRTHVTAAGDVIPRPMYSAIIMQREMVYFRRFGSKSAVIQQNLQESKAPPLPTPRVMAKRRVNSKRHVHKFRSKAHNRCCTSCIRRTEYESQHDGPGLSHESHAGIWTYSARQMV